MSSDSIPTTEEFTPASSGELARFVAENARTERHPLYPVGGRTGLQYGYAASQPGVTINLSSLSRVVDYPSRDMTITVEAGLRISALQETVSAENQQLPIDIAQAHRATIGGAIMADASGPRRYGFGTLRDYVIGVEGVDAQGRLFHAGGRVVKNVAGYDLCKLMVGSHGTLAILTEVTLKLKPAPASTALCCAAFDSFATIDSVLERLLTSDTRPVVLDVLDTQAARQIAAEARGDFPTELPVLIVGYEGAEGDVAWQSQKLQQELPEVAAPAALSVAEGEQAGRLLTALTGYCVASDDPLTFQANLPPSRTMEFLEQCRQAGIAAQAHAGNGIVIGNLPDSTGSASAAAELLQPLRRFARDHRGSLTVLQCEHAWKPEVSVFGEGNGARELMLRLRNQLDPDHLLNPGRFLTDCPDTTP